MMTSTRMVQTCVMLTIFALGSVGQAQEWVKKMFTDTTHDFGIVPRGTDASFEFKFANPYEEKVHVAAVRSSCGCTVPRIKKADLITYEESSIICDFNTKSFIGPKAAVVTVVFTKPFYGEIQLTVKGTIRSDIETDPGTIEFGDLDRGSTRETQVKITARRNNWEISDVRSANQHLGVSLERQQNQPGKVSYLMNVRLKESAPVGEFSDNIVLITNEKDFNQVTIPVRGSILPPLVLPSRIDLGTIKAGEQSKSFFVAKSKTPFEIKEVKCEDTRFNFRLPEGKKDKHIVNFEFLSGDQLGAFRHSISVVTDMAEESTANTFVVGNVAEK